MPVVLTEDQILLKDAAARLIGRAAGPDAARHRMRQGGGPDRAVWSMIAEDAGWLGLLVPQAAGGIGLGLSELSVVMEACGRGLLIAPVAAVCVAARAVADAGEPALRNGLLPAIVGGEAIVVPAFNECAGRFAPEDVTTEARSADRGGVVLTGLKPDVADAMGADGFLVNARAPDGPVLCYLPAESSGLSIDTTPSVDGGGLAALRLDGAPVPPENMLAEGERATRLVTEAADRMAIALAAECLGVMGETHDITIEYLKTRHQFNRPIGSFQAVQHRAVDDHIALELTRSLVFQVCSAADAGRAQPGMAAAAKAQAADAVLRITQSAVQLHGAIGFTDEHVVSLYFKRAMALSAAWGNAALQRERFRQQVAGTTAT